MKNETPNADDFFPEADYKLPVTSNYMKFKDGDNTFRVLSSAIVGFEYWNTDNKPVRSKEAWDTMPEDIKMDKGGNTRINHFWAFVVYNYEAKRVQILELTQKGIMTYMQNLIKNPKWGHPRNYDLTITRTGSGFDTEYTCVANPPSTVDNNILETYHSRKINLEALFDGGDPFAN